MLDAMALEDEVDSIAYAAPFDQATKLLCAQDPSPRCAEVPALTSDNVDASAKHMNASTHRKLRMSGNGTSATSSTGPKPSAFRLIADSRGPLAG
jgi:hypothetical protein